MSLPKIAFQGVHGAYSKIALQMYFGADDSEAVPCSSFTEIFASVVNGDVDYGAVPIENSLAGSLHENYDRLLEHEVEICGEVKLRVRHNLLCKDSSSKISKIYSHPQALLQCKQYLKREYPGAAQVAFFDTAGAAQLVAESEDLGVAAIASEESSKIYGLNLAKKGIEDNPQNFTRFLIVKRIGSPDFKKPSDSDSHKTSIVYALKNKPGILYKSLAAFAVRDIDLLKIESRPLPGSPWQYLFYLDFEGSVRDEACKNALKHLEEMTQYLKILGSYAACELK